MSSSGNHTGVAAGPSQGPRRDSATTRRQGRRSLDKELKAAARNRRRSATEHNHNNPPKLEDIWICEFCEYEAIFGEPPRALIRAYELQDRRVRQEEADRRRLLERAKAKARKGKKAGKAAAKGSVATQPHAEHVDEQSNRSVRSATGHSTQSEDGDYGVDGACDPRPISPPLIEAGGGMKGGGRRGGTRAEQDSSERPIKT